MVGTPVLFDTNVLIDNLNGVEAARDELERHANRAISIITWMEVMAGATTEHEAATRSFLATFISLPITPAIAERAILVRKSNRLKLPDAIIFATALTSGRLLISRNTRDFAVDDPNVRIPYRLQ